MTDPYAETAPAWLLELVAAVEQYEETHTKTDDSNLCFARVIPMIPANLIHMSRGYKIGRKPGDPLEYLLTKNYHGTEPHPAGPISTGCGNPHCDIPWHRPEIV